jgi:hypothetical protein
MSVLSGQTFYSIHSREPGGTRVLIEVKSIAFGMSRYSTRWHLDGATWTERRAAEAVKEMTAKDTAKEHGWQLKEATAYQRHRIRPSGWPQGHGATSTKTKSRACPTWTPAPSSTHARPLLQPPGAGRAVESREKQSTDSRTPLVGTQGVGGSAGGHMPFAAPPRPRSPGCGRAAGTPQRGRFAHALTQRAAETHIESTGGMHRRLGDYPPPPPPPHNTPGEPTSTETKPYLHYAPSASGFVLESLQLHCALAGFPSLSTDQAAAARARGGGLPEPERQRQLEWGALLGDRTEKQRTEGQRPERQQLVGGSTWGLVPPEPAAGRCVYAWGVGVVPELELRAQLGYVNYVDSERRAHGIERLPAAAGRAAGWYWCWGAGAGVAYEALVTWGPGWGSAEGLWV